MNRRTAEVILVAAVVVLVLSIASATLNSTTTSSGGGGLSDGNGSSLFPEIETNLSGSTGEVTPPTAAILVIAVLGAFLAIWYLLSNPTRAIALIVGSAVLFAIGFLILYLIANFFGEPGGNGGGGGLFGGQGTGSGIGSDTGTIAPDTLEVLAILAIGLVFVGVLLRTTSDGTSEELASEEADGDDVDLDAIARTAGRAADRIEGDAAVDNEVYRAWREMTDLLDVPDPETSTPREFATAAVEAGMDEDDVTELTVLFEEVRYGTAEPTGDREQRAVDALRRIEAYAGAES